MTKNLHELFLRRLDSDAAADVFYGECLARAKRAVSRRLPTEHIDDVAQDCVVAMLGSMERFDPKRSKFQTWFERIITNTVNDALRIQITAQETLTELADDMQVPSPSMDGLIDVSFILDPITRRIVDSVLEGATLSEAGREVGLSKSAVSMRLRRLRKQRFPCELSASAEEY